MAVGGKTVINIKGFKPEEWLVNGITTGHGGRIVVSGLASDDQSHVTVLNQNGELLRQDKFRSRHKDKYPHHPHRFCAILPGFKVATVAAPCEIGLYDVRNGLYTEKTIPDITTNWYDDMCVRCVATDIVKEQILVGTNYRLVFVFDYELKFCHTMKLPYLVRSLFDMAVVSNALLVCDYEKKTALTVTEEEGGGRLYRELSLFASPDPDEPDWIPISVCKDKSGFIYILWVRYRADGRQCVVVKYSKDGHRRVSSKPVNKDSYCLSILEAHNIGSLLVATLDSGKLFSFDMKINF
ncbi:hypothetical protein BSL78_07892 [Apostichopus japonicus]|uniref:Uncharacterized protein n=1 Tax=Stichopus japonicus TaxID=307972 RepID=A0A2G8L4J5_STIJA|nr:hypothetical protein BSL78_07892 [Apostichopus japonicus]